MKYSIIICPKNENSNAIDHAYRFIQAIIMNSSEANLHSIDVFFYGYAVEKAFNIEPRWHEFSNHDISLTACSTIAEKFISKNQKPAPFIKVSGLGQWMNSTMLADKHIEFV